MRTVEQIEREISNKRELAESSEKMRQQVGNYIAALEWVLEGDVEEVSRLMYHESDPHFSELIFGGRTAPDRFISHLTIDEDGCYIVSKVPLHVVKDSYY